MRKYLPWMSLMLCSFICPIYAATCPDPSSIRCLKLPSGETICSTRVAGWVSPERYPMEIMGPMNFTMAELVLAPDSKFKPACSYVDSNGVSITLYSDATFTPKGSTWSPDASNKDAGDYTCNSSNITNCQMNPT